MNRSLLITRPKYDDTTWYFFYWSKEIIAEAKKRGIPIIDLDQKRANRKEVTSVLEKRKPKLIVFNGHGNENEIAGEDGEVIINKTNALTLEEKIAYARACRAAKALGHKCIASNCQAFIGYDEDFIFMYNPQMISRPVEDKTAKLFLGPSNYAVISLLKDHTAGSSNQKSKALFLKNIEKLLTASPTSEDYNAIRFLYWDLVHQVCLGDASAKL